MSTFYIDLDNGNDSNTGADWANAWKTITSGATAARIAAGDEIRISKTPAPYSIGSAKWTGVTSGTAPSTKSVSAATNATPIVITSNLHGYSNGDCIRITGVGGNLAANGVWEIANVATNTFELVGSSGSGAYTSGGTAQLLNWKCVKLSTAQTKDVTKCEVAWTAANSATCSRATGSVRKEGDSMAYTAFPASPSTSTKYAYYQIPSTDFSSYQRLSFWIYVNADCGADRLKLCLCSDTAGDTIVDTFKIPALETSNSICLVITKDGGGNLGSAIQSIALYSDTSAPPNSIQVSIDNVIACTTSGLNLTSLISKNSSEQGGTEAWYGIQSINNTVIVLDNYTNPDGGRGYFGATETVTTYARETYKTAMATSSTTAINTVNDSGTSTSYIKFSGGWNTSSGLQDGETLFDGQNGYGYGLYLTAKNYCEFEQLGFFRYYDGVNLNSGTGHKLTNIRAGNNGQHGINIGGARNNYIDQILQANNNQSSGVRITYRNIVNKILNNNNNIINGLLVSYPNNLVKNITAKNNGYGILISTGGSCDIFNAATAYNANSGVYAETGVIAYLYNSVFEETTEIDLANGYGGRVYSHRHDDTDNKHWAFWGSGTTVNSQAATMTNAAGSTEWKITIGNSGFHLYDAVVLNVGKLAVGASSQVTATIYIKKGHATNVGCRLILRGGQIAGADSDVIDTADDNTDEQQLSISFTPTEAGVVQLQLEAWYIGGNSTILFDNLSVTQS